MARRALRTMTLCPPVTSPTALWAGLALAALGCGDDTTDTGGAGGSGSSSTAVTSSQSTSTTTTTATSSGAGGEGGAPAQGSLVLATPYVDPGGKVPLRVLRISSPGDALDVSADAVVSSLDADLLVVEDGVAVGIATGAARVEVEHAGETVEATLRVRGWTRAGFQEQANLSVGFDGTVLLATAGGSLLLPPGSTSWSSPIGGDGYGAAPLAGARFLLPRGAAVLAVGGSSSGAQPSFAPASEAVPFEGGRCAVLAEHGPPYLRRWCDGGDVTEIAWPSEDDTQDSLAVDDRGRVAFVTTDGRVHLETAAGDFAALETDGGGSPFARRLAMRADGLGWVAWVSSADGEVHAARFVDGAFEEPTTLGLPATDVQLAVLPDGRAVVAARSGQDDIVQVIPDGASLEPGDKVRLYGGRGGRVHAVLTRDDLIEIHSTDGDTWTVEDRSGCDVDRIGFAAGDPEHLGFAVECSDGTGWLDVYR